jgi:hypothetical protein
MALTAKCIRGISLQMTTVKHATNLAFVLDRLPCLTALRLGGDIDPVALRRVLPTLQHVALDIPYGPSEVAKLLCDVIKTKSKLKSIRVIDDLDGTLAEAICHMAPGQLRCLWIDRCHAQHLLAALTAQENLQNVRLLKVENTDAVLGALERQQNLKSITMQPKELFSEVQALRLLRLATECIGLTEFKALGLPKPLPDSFFTAVHKLLHARRRTLRYFVLSRLLAVELPLLICDEFGQNVFVSMRPITVAFSVDDIPEDVRPWLHAMLPGLRSFGKTTVKANYT